jgi:hypothetical protein
MGRSPRQDRAATVATAAVPLAVLVIGAWILSGPPTRLAFRLYDDAYYYFGVARSLAAGSGSTFDQIHATNGYHPLWTWLLVPVLGVFRDPDAGVRAAGALWFVTAAASTVAVAWAVRPRSGPAGGAVAAAIFGLFPFVGLALERPNGLETPLYALTLALAAGLFERAGPNPGRGRVAVLGVAAGCVALARLDGAFLAVSMAILLAAGGSRAGGVRRAALVGCLSAALVAPFLVWGAVRFGSPLPVSGRIVSLGAARERAALGGAGSPAFWQRRARYAVRDIPSAVGRVALDRLPGTAPLRGGALAGGIAIAAWTAAVGGGLLRRRRAGPLRQDALALLALFAVLHYAAYALWLWTGGEERYRLYYFLPQWMAFAWGAGSLSPPRAGWIAAALAGVLTLHTALAVRARDAYQDVSERPVTESFVYGWVREHLPPDAVLGARDAGKLGWFSGRRVVNLDGLINDQRMVEAIRDGEEARYVFDSPIDYLFFSPASAAGPHVAGLIRRLDERADCDVRRLPGDTGGWAVFQVSRSGR